MAKAWMLCLMVGCVGLVLVQLLCALGLDDTIQYNGHIIFYYLVATLEPTALIVWIAFILGMFWWWSAQQPETEGVSIDECRGNNRLPLWVGGLGVVVFIITWMGGHFIMHSYALSMDEFCADFQATIFLEGKRQATIAAEWLPYIKALKPIYVNYDEVNHTWMANYLPVYAALRALFLGIGTPLLLNPLLAAVTLVILSLLALRLWPEQPKYAWVAALLLAANTSFLLTSMSGYSLPLTLLLNVAWLYLYQYGGQCGSRLAPWLGALALAVHQPFSHALFVLPFLLRMVWERRWGKSLYYASVYLIGLAACVIWWEGGSHVGAVATGFKLFAVPSLFDLVGQVADFVLLFSWSSPIWGILLVVTFSKWSAKSVQQPLMLDLASGCVLTWMFYSFLEINPGHGWGYRYFYPVWGNAILLSLLGWDLLVREFGEKRMWRLLAFSVCFSWVVQLPLRSWQAERLIRPYAEASKMVHELPVNLVLIDVNGSFYARDLIRNDPFERNYPRIMSREKLTEAQVMELMKRYSVKIIGRPDLEKMGLRSSRGSGQ